MALLKMKPVFKDYLWGGHKLVDEFKMDFDGPILAESWMLSCYPDNSSVIENGKDAGMILPEYIQKYGFTNVLGKNCERFEDFPVLIKFIDAKGVLSIQVHPDNEYARIHENQYGKTEMWIILEAEEGSYLYYGFEHEISKEEFAKRIEENTLTDVLHKLYVQKGDVVFIKAGTLHAIGAGITLAEIQQNSNVTYRIYDFGRKDKDGNLRPLHIKQALDVTKRTPVERIESCAPHIGQCEAFTVDRIALSGKETKKLEGTVNENSFLSVLITSGEGTICNGEECLPFRKGDSFLLTAGSGDWSMEGTCEALLTSEEK